jgi:peptide/nickel transport system substrate-binding protein
LEELVFEKLLLFATLLCCTHCVIYGQPFTTAEKPGRYGGSLVVALRSEPKTLNPASAMDDPSREVIQLLMADLVHINRTSQETAPSLARRVVTSADGKRFTVELRRGLRFSDGHPFDADDVVFTFQVYLDEKTGSSQRDLLVIGGKPISVRKIDAYTVEFEFAKPYGPGQRLFDSLYILPRHLLLEPFREGKLDQAWGLNSAPEAIAGLGPFRFSRYVPGQRLTLDRNPYYWKQDSAQRRLPYLDNVVFEFVGSADAEALRFESGGATVIDRLGARNFETLLRRSNREQVLKDLGPSLEYDFLFFNLNDLATRHLAAIESKQAWFRDVNFRRAVSAAIDRNAMARIVFAGRATPICGPVSPASRAWIDDGLPPCEHSVARARQLLAASGFKWNRSGALMDGSGQPIEFSILTSVSNAQRVQMATMIQQDLQTLGIRVRVVELEFRSMLDRITNRFDYEACLLGLTSGDADPGSDMNVWVSNGSTHLWHLGEDRPATGWEADIDQLMAAQMSTPKYSERKQLFDRVQDLIRENLPIICLVSPNVLVGANERLRNFHPAVLPPHVLWNADELFFNSR